MKKINPHLTGVLICVPAFGQQMAAHTAQSLCNLVQWLTFNGVPNSTCWLSMADIAEARNLFLTVWYDGHPEFSHLLFVDADMEFPTKLVEDMLRFGKPLTGCLYARRQHPAQAVGKTLAEHNSIDHVKDGFLQVAGVGAGVLLIARHAVRTMIDKMPEIVDTNVAGHPGTNTLKAANSKRLIRAFDPFLNDAGVRLSEDLAFCERWRKCDGQVWANVDHLIGHIGSFNYAIRYADYLENKARDDFAAKVAAA